VITGDIKANFPARMALSVKTGKDSEVILGEGKTEAKHLIGRGDALFESAKHPQIRIQTPYVGTKQVKEMLGAITKPAFSEQPVLNQPVSPDTQSNGENNGSNSYQITTQRAIVTPQSNAIMENSVADTRFNNAKERAFAALRINPNMSTDALMEIASIEKRSTARVYRHEFNKKESKG